MAFECVKKALQPFLAGGVVLVSAEKIQLSYAVFFYKMICYQLYLVTVVRHYAVAVGVIILFSDSEYRYVFLYRTFDSMLYHFFAVAQIERCDNEHIDNIIVRKIEDVGLTYIVRCTLIVAGTAVEDMNVYLIVAQHIAKTLQ